MNKFSLPIFGILLVFAALIISGGFYRTETVQLGIVHRTNIITGELSICALEEGCKLFSEQPEPIKPVQSTAKIDDQAFYTISHIRSLYPQYDDYTDLELAEGMFNKFIAETNSNASKEAFFEVVGYKN